MNPASHCWKFGGFVGRGAGETRRRLRLILAWTVGHGPGPRLLNRGTGIGGHRGSFNAGLGRREIAVRFAKSMDYQTTQGPLHGGDAGQCRGWKGGFSLLSLLNGSEVTFSACKITHRAEQPPLITFDEHVLFTNYLVLLLILSKLRGWSEKLISYKPSNFAILCSFVKF